MVISGNIISSYSQNSFAQFAKGKNEAENQKGPKPSTSGTAKGSQKELSDDEKKQLEELKRILRTKFDAPDDLIAETVWLLHQDTIMAPSEPLASIPLRDAADIAIISAALNGGAEILVTGDKEMVELKKCGALQIVTPRQFWERQKGQRHPGHRHSRGSA